MQLEQIENRQIKIHKNSITVLNDAGKTAGVVRGITQYKDLPPRISFDFFKKVCMAGLWGNGESENIYYDYSSKQIFYLYDLGYEKRNRMFPECVEKKQALRNKAAEHITVIQAYFN